MTPRERALDVYAAAGPVRLVHVQNGTAACDVAILGGPAQCARVPGHPGDHVSSDGLSAAQLTDEQLLAHEVEELGRAADGLLTDYTTLKAAALALLGEIQQSLDDGFGSAGVRLTLVSVPTASIDRLKGACK